MDRGFEINIHTLLKDIDLQARRMACPNPSQVTVVSSEGVGGREGGSVCDCVCVMCVYMCVCVGS